MGGEKSKRVLENDGERMNSRLAFLNVRIFVTASEGEELIVNVGHVGRVVDCGCNGRYDC